MENLKSFIEKANSDPGLMSKLDAFGKRNAGVDEIVALAADYGFSITKEEYKHALSESGKLKTGELSEEDLEAASGGGTQNRYNPEICGQYEKAHYYCVGFLQSCHCDHYRETLLTKLSNNKFEYNVRCVMGYFDYKYTVVKEGIY